MTKTYIELLASITQIDIEIAQSEGRRRLLLAERERMRLHDAKAGDVLRQAVWSLVVRPAYFGKSPKSMLVLEGHNDTFQVLSNLLEDEYHCQSNFEEGVVLRFDDGCITLSFDTLKVLCGFIVQYRLSVSTAEVREEVSKLQTKALGLQNIVNALEETMPGA